MINDRGHAPHHCAGNVYWSCAATGAVLGAPAVDPSSSVMFFTSTDTCVCSSDVHWLCAVAVVWVRNGGVEGLGACERVCAGLQVCVCGGDGQ